jgi:hypothetical protein
MTLRKRLKTLEAQEPDPGEEPRTILLQFVSSNGNGTLGPVVEERLVTIPPQPRRRHRAAR